MTRQSIVLIVLLILVIIRLFTVKNLQSAVVTDPMLAIRQKLAISSSIYLPKVHADLLLGMTIGVDDVKGDIDFYSALIKTGLVHVVVVSGYNVALVIKFMSSIFYDKLKNRNRIVILVLLVVYVSLCGFQPPTIRAALMGFVAYLASVEGRNVDGLRLLLFICLLMLLLFPEYVSSLSFWLSAGSTLGLILFEAPVSRCVGNVFSKIPYRNYLPFGDLSTSLACQAVVLPIIAFSFGRLSLASPLYNMMLLWLIPICTIFGFVFLFIATLAPFFGYFAARLVFPPLDVFIRGVGFLANIDRFSIDLKISGIFLVLYYLILYFIYLKLKKTKPKFPSSLD